MGFNRNSFIRSQEGITALEFALLAPAMFLIIMGIIEFSMIMFTSSVMEGATIHSSRLGKTGYVADGTTRQQQIIDNINARTAGLLDPDDITITSEVYSDFNDVDQPEPCISPPTPPCSGTVGVNYVDVNGNGSWDQDMGAAGLGNPGDVVVYTVTYPWTVTTPIINSIIGSTFNITARSVVRNEPYGTSMR